MKFNPVKVVHVYYKPMDDKVFEVTLYTGDIGYTLAFKEILRCLGRSRTSDHLVRSPLGIFIICLKSMPCDA